MNGKDFQFYKGEPLNLRRSARVFDGAEPRPDWQARAEAAEAAIARLETCGDCGYSAPQSLLVGARLAAGACCSICYDREQLAAAETTIARVREVQEDATFKCSCGCERHGVDVDALADALEHRTGVK
jgi:hypothetical protein